LGEGPPGWNISGIKLFIEFFHASDI